ncbi:uncharacterized protein LOC114327293 [Diabrotica virgifera virgifera]|uniref:Uncharacterized protein LOC114327293 n=1 Tax=Diabrotica virgifera virgifera TaxID=50390 RepID=A0A6P7FE81_DIAVI|nr:uncharacterized protein LOC114327293 [Diabrotica virgifera virgifera]
MAFIIPDKILETLICTCCHKYLSVKPITVYPNRDVECGRCAVTNKQKQRVGVESLYGKIIEKCLFKCINRFDGCRELLTYSQVLDHEKVCLEKIHQCPICYKEMTSFLMVRHLHSNHKDAILRCPGFVFNLKHYLKRPSTYIYQDEDNLFFLYISYSKSENTIKLELVYMGRDKLASNIYHQFTVTDENKEFNFKSKPSRANEFSIVDASDTSKLIYVEFKLIYQNLQFFTISENLHSSSIKNSLETSNQNLEVLPIPENANSSSSSINNSLEKPRPNQGKIQFIYKSPLDYTTEVVEFHSEYNPQCFNCQESCIFSFFDSYEPEYYYSPTHNDFLCFCCFEWLTHENKIKENRLYFKQSIPSTLRTRFCKWKCGKDFKFSEIVSHEIYCNKRIYYYKCPYPNCRIKNNSALSLKNHLKARHDDDVEVSPSFFKLLKPPFSFYVFLEDQLIGFDLTTSDKYDIQCKINIYNDTIQSNRKPHALFFYNNKFTPLANLPLSTSPENCAAKIVLTKNE